MERLTMSKGLCQMVSTEYCHQHRDCYECEHGRNVFKRLAAYEDTGLMPEEIGKRSVCKVCPIPEGVTDEDVSRALELLAAENDGRCTMKWCEVFQCWCDDIDDILQDEELQYCGRLCEECDACIEVKGGAE